jgi:hypothetical protein
MPPVSVKFVLQQKKKNVLFVCDLFDDSVSNSEYFASNNKMINE